MTWFLNLECGILIAVLASRNDEGGTCQLTRHTEPSRPLSDMKQKTFLKI